MYTLNYHITYVNMAPFRTSNRNFRAEAKVMVSFEALDASAQ